MISEDDQSDSTDLGTMSKISANMWKKCSPEVRMVSFWKLVYQTMVINDKKRMHSNTRMHIPVGFGQQDWYQGIKNVKLHATFNLLPKFKVVLVQNSQY